MYFDRMDYLYDRALRTYCELEKKDAAGLSDEALWEISRRSCAHTGFFFTWLARRHMEGAIHQEDPLEAVRIGEMAGTDFFLRCCDGKFRDEDVRPGAAGSHRAASALPGHDLAPAGPNPCCPRGI